MKLYLDEKPIGRKIGRIGEYMLYEKSLVKEKYIEQEEIDIERDTTFNFTFGPSAGGLTESIAFNLLTTGESIQKIVCDPTFKMRNLNLLGKNIEDTIPLIERINGPFAASHTIAFLSAVEDAMEIEIDENTLMSRIIEIELERLRNHLHVIGRMCEAAALGVSYNALFYLREIMNRLIKNYMGHRYYFGVNKIGEINADFTGITRSLDNIKEEARDLYTSLLETKIFVDRLQDNGCITTTECVGPTARGAGYKFDARIDSHSLPYKELDFIPFIEEGIGNDAMSRFIIRFEEIFQSIDIIKRAEMKLGNSNKETPKGKSNGDGVGRVESPSGDLSYLVKLYNGKIKNLNILTSSEINLPVFLKSATNTLFTDFSFNWESFGIWVSEIGVKFV